MTCWSRLAKCSAGPDVKRPDPTVAAAYLRIARREQDIRDRVNENADKLLALGMLFGNYRLEPHPELVEKQLGFITELELMALPEHRSGIAGALVGVSGLHPEMKAQWYALAPKLFAAAESLVPSGEAEALLTRDHIEFLWMLWMTTGDVAILRRLFKEAHKGGQSGDCATAMIALHSHLPEVATELLRSVEAGRTVGNAPVALPHLQTTQRKDVPQAEVKLLNQHVAALPGGIERVLLVGWTPAQGGTFIIITPDGKVWDACPKEWVGRPVAFIKADPQQLALHQQLLARRNDP